MKVQVDPNLKELGSLVRESAKYCGYYKGDQPEFRATPKDRIGHDKDPLLVPALTPAEIEVQGAFRAASRKR